jgi:hypothetical protein
MPPNMMTPHTLPHTTHRVTHENTNTLTLTRYLQVRMGGWSFLSQLLAVPLSLLIDIRSTCEHGEEGGETLLFRVPFCCSSTSSSPIALAREALVFP